MKKRNSILIVTKNIPYPLDSGGNVSQYAVLMALQEYIDITLCVFAYSQQELDNVEALRPKLKKVEFEVVDFVNRAVPTKSFKQIVKGAIKSALKNPFAAKQPAAVAIENDDFDSNLQPIYVKGEGYINKFLKAVNSKPFDLIQIEFFELLDLVHVLPPHIPSIFVHHEIRYQRFISSALVSPKSEIYKNYVINNVKYCELALLDKFDAIIAFSNDDKEILAKDLGDKVCAIPFPVLKEEFWPARKSATLDKIIFLGKEEFPPNREGVFWFIEEIFPTIWANYKLPLYIIGKWSEQTKAELAQEGKIIFTGFVEDISALAAASIQLCPIRVGSGIRTKIIYAMANRVPVISTTIGAGGLEVESYKDIILANKLDEFDAGFNKFLNDPDFLLNLTNNAYNVVEHSYSEESVANKRMQLYTRLIEAKK